ncbi:Hypothetical protein AT6N2_L0879 [Agrobacterium tumefaciens]|nr:Hypothetical protein AT6N2_L0879 [Agrobacterium tumefaciens]
MVLTSSVAPKMPPMPMIQKPAFLRSMYPNIQAMQMMITAMIASRRAIFPVSIVTMFCSTLSIPADWAKAGSTRQATMAMAISVEAVRGRRLLIRIIQCSDLLFWKTRTEGRPLERNTSHDALSSVWTTFLGIG